MMAFELDYVLENKWVKLIPMCDKHVEDLLPYVLNEPQLWAFSLYGPKGEEGLKKYIEQAEEARVAEQAYPFVVYSKELQKVVGSTRIYDISLSQKYASIGYTWYATEAQGTKVNKASKLLLFDFAFNKMELERVELRADARNKRSVAAILSVGCTHEGTLRSTGFSQDGFRRDSEVFSMLKSEWNKDKRQVLLDKL